MGGAVSSPCYLTWGQTVVEVMKIMAPLSKVPCQHCCNQWPGSCSVPPLTHTFARDSWLPTGRSGSVSCGITAPFSWVLVLTRFCFWPPKESVSSVLYKLWQLYGGVNADLLQEGLCHTQFCCIQSPYPWGRLLLTHTSTGDTQPLKRQVWLNLCGVSWCTQGFVWALQASVAGMVFDSKRDYTPPSVFPWKESYDQPRQHIKKQRHNFANKGPSLQGYGFFSSHVWIWELDYK